MVWSFRRGGSRGADAGSKLDARHQHTRGRHRLFYVRTTSEYDQLGSPRSSRDLARFCIGAASSAERLRILSITIVKSQVEENENGSICHHIGVLHSHNMSE